MKQKELTLYEITQQETDAIRSRGLQIIYEVPEYNQDAICLLHLPKSHIFSKKNKEPYNIRLKVLSSEIYSGTGLIDPHNLSTNQLVNILENQIGLLLTKIPDLASKKEPFKIYIEDKAWQPAVETLINKYLK